MGASSPSTKRNPARNAPARSAAANATNPAALIALAVVRAFFHVPTALTSMPAPSFQLFAEDSANVSHENAPAARKRTSIASRGPSRSENTPGPGVEVLRSQRQAQGGEGIDHHLHPG